MATNVFISWSGSLSRELAEALKLWLPSVLQNVRPYFSPEDIEKGAKWESSIAVALEASDIGIICLTSENTEKPWILFEAGALSKSMQNGRVCTVLFGMDSSQIKGPLLGFQATHFRRDDFKNLLRTINSAAGEHSLDQSVLDNVFEMWWPQLEKTVSSILSNHSKAVPTREPRGEKDILEEVLELTRLSASRTLAVRRDIEPAMFHLLNVIADILEVAPTEARSALLMELERALEPLLIEAGLPPFVVHDIFGSRGISTRSKGRLRSRGGVDKEPRHTS